MFRLLTRMNTECNYNNNNDDNDDDDNNNNNNNNNNSSNNSNSNNNNNNNNSLHTMAPKKWANHMFRSHIVVQKTCFSYYMKKNAISRIQNFI